MTKTPKPTMTKELLLDTLGAILVEEREAIRRLDAVAMDRASDAKEAVLLGLHAVPYEDRAPLVEALAILQPALRHNMTLLLHATLSLAEARRTAARHLPSQRLAS